MSAPAEPEIEVLLDSRLVEFLNTLAERVCEGPFKEFVKRQCLALETLEGNVHYVRGLMTERPALEKRRFEAACVLYLTERTTQIWAQTPTGRS